MQKLLGDKLYVFDLTPYEITQQTEDASVIYVQNECIDGYKELNVSLADKIEGFNQFVLCVTDPWKEGVEPAPVYTITLNGTNLTDKVTIKINNEAVELAGSYEVPQSVWFEIFPTDDPSYYSLSSSPSIEWSDEEPVHWYTKDQDVTINLTYTAPAHTVVLTAPYDLPIFDEAANGWVDMTQDSEDPTLEKGDVEYGKTYSVEQRSGIGEGKTVSMDPNYLTGEQGTVGVAFTIPNDGTAANCTITLTTPKQDPELAWSANSATVTIGALDNVFPTLSNPHDISDGLTYSSTFPEIADIDAYGNITLVMSGETEISAIFAGDETYNASTVTYALTVEDGGGESGSSDDE